MTGVGIDRRRQFRALYRAFLFRVVDGEILSASGDVRRLLGQFVALLAAYSFVLALFTVGQFALATASPAKLAVGAWSTEEFLISSTLTAVGLFAVLSWNNLLPDRRDALILDPLPVRTATVLRARAAATASALAIALIAVNVFTGLAFPLAIGGGIAGGMRCLAAYWCSMVAAGLFAFGSVFALQSSAAALLPHRLFQRVSGWLQLAVFFGTLGLFFLTPPLANPAALRAPSNEHLLACLPSFWFLGLFQKLNGSHFPSFGPLAARSLGSLGAVWLAGAGAAALGYARMARRAIEQPDIAPGQRVGILSHAAAFCVRRLFPDPIDRAIVLFSARTLARSREHRLLLAVYLGGALAFALAYVKNFVYGRASSPWNQPGQALLAVSFAGLFLLITGTRTAFAMPFALPAHWIFRLTAIRPPACYFSAVRKALFVLAALPVLFVSALTYFLLWPGRFALLHLFVLLALAVSLTQASLRSFRKIPFACSYLPGKSNLHIRFGAVGVVFLAAVELGANLELWSFARPARYLVVLALLLAGALWATRRTIARAASPHARLQFEDLPIRDIHALDLRREAEDIDNSAAPDTLTAWAEHARR